MLNGPDMCLQAVRRSSLAEEDWGVQAVPCDRMAEHAVPGPQGLPTWRKVNERVSLERRIYNQVQARERLESGQT